MKRTVCKLSVPSLQPITTSWPKKAGARESVVRDIISHRTELVSRQCTHVDDATKRNAIRNLTNIFSIPA